MNKETIIRKLTSRKLWLAIALFVSGVLTAAGKDRTAEVVSGLIMQAAAVIGYIVGEGLVDAAKKSESQHPPDSSDEEICPVTDLGYDDYYEDGSPKEKHGVIFSETMDDEDGEGDA